MIEQAGLRIAMNLSTWERLLERLRVGERWEYLAADGCWVRYWRRGGHVPREAVVAHAAFPWLRDLDE